MPSVLLVLLLVTAACGRTAGGPTAASSSCETDADCVLDCTTGSNCCGPLCGCEVAVSRAQAKANRADYQYRCEGKQLDCPVASCAKPNYDVTAKCQSRRCIAERTPAPTEAPGPTVVQVDGLYTLAGAPAPRACAADADCIGDTVPAADLCCQEPMTVVAHARAWRTWINDWRTRSCAGRTCPPPPNPAQPPDCLFEVSCQDKRCENACPR